MFRYVRNPRIESSFLLDKVTKKTPVDFQKRFPIYHDYPRYLAAYHGGSAFLRDGVASLQDLDEVGVTLVDWQRGMVGCVLIQYI